jgi:NitT/TauT family transport system permease protein
MSALGRILPPALLIALLLGAWEASCRLLDVPVYLLPAPSAVAGAVAADVPALLQGAGATLAMAMTALVLALVCAALLALAGGLNPLIENAVQPLAVTIQVTPVVAIAPLIVIWTGLDHPDRAIVILAAVVAFFPIYSGMAAGLRSADPDLERLFDLYGASGWQKLWRLRLPSAAPFLFESLKVGSALAMIGAVVAEFVAGSGAAQGLAWRIVEAANRLQTSKMFAALLVLAVMAALLHGVMTLVERRALAWWRGR